MVKAQIIRQPSILSLFHYRRYIVRNAWNDLRLRYAGSSAGALWNILIPLAQILIFTTIFTQLMTLRNPSAANSPYIFVLYLCAGLLPWFSFSGSILRGSNALLANARYLNKLPIPEEIFVAQAVVSETFGLMIYLVLLIITAIVLGHELGGAVLLMPVVGLLFQLLAFGFGLSLACLRVFFQDIGHALTVIMQLWWWTLPIVYMEDILPETLQSWLFLNPPYLYIRTFRDLYLYNHIPDWSTWVGMIAWAAGLTCLGLIILWRLRPELRDEL